MIVSHAHNDHIGRLPCLVRAGYQGPDLRDPGHRRHHQRHAPRQRPDPARGRCATRTLKNPDDEPIEPLFELADVEWVVEQLQRLPYGEPLEIVAGRHADLPRRRPHPRLGHRPARLPEDGRDRRFVFTGDLGRRNMGLLPDPTIVKDIDILVSESTYGNRELDPYDR